MSQDDKPLSIKHQHFIEFILVDQMDVVEAYMKVYPRATKESAQSKAPKLLKKVRKSSFYVQKSRKMSEKMDVSIENIVKDLQRVVREGFGSDIYEEHISPKTGEIHTLTKRTKNLNAVNKASETIAKLFGYFPDQRLKIEQNTEHSGGIDINVNFS